MTTSRSNRSSKFNGPPDPTDIEQLKRYHAEISELLARYDTERTIPEKVSFHLRRHLPLYALGAIFALVVILVPTTNERNNATNTAGSLTNGGSDTTALGTTDESTSTKGATGTQALGSGSSGTGGAATEVAGKKLGKVLVGAGKTVAGFDCRPGVRQIPFSLYAAPCVAKFTGFNGGATYRGVTKDTIKFVIRKTSDSGGPEAATVDQANKAAGRASRTEYLEFVKKYWLPYFNKTYELYGRHVEFVEYGSTQSNGVDEAQSKGKDGACADATAIANSVKAFGDLLFATGFGESQPFAQCAKEKGGIFVPLAAAYYPEGKVPDPKGLNLSGLSYQSWRPYVYHIVMQCEQISQDVAEYIGKRLAHRKAKWAGDPAYQVKERVFGTYVPDNNGYQHCVNLTEKKLKDDYNVVGAWRHNYPLDVAQFPQHSAQAVLEFQAHGVTTLINACDTISTQLMTNAARSNGWKPEWFIIGVANQDTNGSARGFDQSQVDGHMFGMSQLGPDIKSLSKGSEPYRAFKAANPSVSPPAGSLQAYWPLVHIFNLLQAAGPILTPQNIEAGAVRLPPGGGNTGAVGTWSLRTSHTQIIDSREIYWDRSVKAFDGGSGSYVETYGGKRFGTGEWPVGEPPVYPKKK